MNSSMLSAQWLLPIFIVVSISVTATSSKIPRLSPVRGTILLDPEILSAPISEDFQTFFYTQTLDHFNYRPESYSNFQQRYVINFKYWGGSNSNAPIFAYLGAEAPLDGDLPIIGFLPDNALRFKALLVYIEVDIPHFCSNCYIIFRFLFFLLSRSSSIFFSCISIATMGNRSLLRREKKP